MNFFTTCSGAFIGVSLWSARLPVYFSAVIFVLLLAGIQYPVVLAQIGENNRNEFGSNPSTYEDPAILGLSIRYNSSDWSHAQNANFLVFTKRSDAPANLIINKASKPDNLPIVDFAKAKQESLLRKWPTYAVVDPIAPITINGHNGVYWTAEYKGDDQWIKSLACVVEYPAGNSAVVLQYIAPAAGGQYEASLESAREMINSVDFITSSTATAQNGY